MNSHSPELRLSRAEVAASERLGPSYFVLRVRCADLLPPQPGQFAMLRPLGARGSSVFLSRPLSVTGFGETVDFLVKIVGEGTRLLSELRQGDPVGIVAPLGTGFPALDGIARPLLVAGGAGAAPLLFLADALHAKGKEIAVLYGARTAAELVARDRFAAVAALETATDDGTRGRKGTVAALLDERLQGGAHDAVVACGPRPMLAAVAGAAARRGLPCVVSVETLMACGFGACLGCPVPAAAGGYLYACRDGPVLDAARVDWKRFT